MQNLTFSLEIYINRLGSSVFFQTLTWKTVFGSRLYQSFRRGGSLIRLRALHVCIHSLNEKSPDDVAREEFHCKKLRLIESNLIDPTLGSNNWQWRGRGCLYGPISFSCDDLGVDVSEMAFVMKIHSFPSSLLPQHIYSDSQTLFALVSLLYS